MKVPKPALHVIAISCAFALAGCAIGLWRSIRSYYRPAPFTYWREESTWTTAPADTPPKLGPNEVVVTVTAPTKTIDEHSTFTMESNPSQNSGVIDVTKAMSVKTIASDFALVFSGPPEPLSFFTVCVSNEDHENAHTVTFPAALMKTDRDDAGTIITSLDIPKNSSRTIAFGMVGKDKPVLHVFASEPWQNPTTALPATMPEVTTAKGLLDGEGVTAKASDSAVAYTTTSSFSAIDPTLYEPSGITLRAGNGEINISFKTGKVEIPEGVSNDEAAKAFWQAVERYVPRTAQSMEGKIVVTLAEAEEVVKALDILKRYSSSRWAYEPSAASGISISGTGWVTTFGSSYDYRSEAQKLEDEAEDLEASAKQKRAKAEQMKNEERDVKWAMATIEKWRTRVKEWK